MCDMNEKTEASGPTAEDLEKCDPPYIRPKATPPRNPVRCWRMDELPDAEERPDTRFLDTRWLMGRRQDNGDIDPNHYETTHRFFFKKPEPCPDAGARRLRLFWNFLLNKMTESVCAERKEESVPEPYCTEYTCEYNDENFTPVLDVDLAQPSGDREEKFPLYSRDTPCSYWYQKQRLPARIGCFNNVSHIWNPVIPFRRSGAFTKPIEQALYDPGLL